MVPPPNQNTVGVRNLIAILTFNYICSTLVTLLKVTDDLILSLMFFILMLVSSSSNLAVSYTFF